MSKPCENAPLLERADVQALTSGAWAAQLVKSCEARVVDGRLYPAFPGEAIQRQFVGSANADALGEALSFYDFVCANMANRAYERCESTRYADFGCGWGRIGRFFLQRFERGDMVGLDIDPDMVAFCRAADLPGLYLAIQNQRRLPFADNAFKLITAYSVFTHLPEHLFRFWMGELGRVLAPGGMMVFTVEPARFLDFIDSIGATPESPWHAALARNKPDTARHRRAVETRGIAIMPNGGGGVRTTDVYGDTVVSRAFVADLVAPFGAVDVFLDDAGKFWQAVVVVRKRRASGVVGWARDVFRRARPA